MLKYWVGKKIFGRDIKKYKICRHLESLEFHKNLEKWPGVCHMLAQNQHTRLISYLVMELETPNSLFSTLFCRDTFLNGGQIDASVLRLRGRHELRRAENLRKIYIENITELRIRELLLAPVSGSGFSGSDCGRHRGMRTNGYGWRSGNSRS